MEFLGWTAATGGLLLLMSLASGWIKRGPITVFALYLTAGIVCGPWVLNLLQVDITAHAELAKNITEIAIAASLFITGLKLRLPLKSQGWYIGLRLAFPGMLLTVAGVALAAHYLAELSWPLSLAFGAIVAPTDPVLASLISVNDARDSDNLRVSLSSEAGMNDGSALPLLILAVMMITTPGGLSLAAFGQWALVDVLWAITAGVSIGFAMGRLVGQYATHLRHTHQDVAPNDFLALALIALSYAAAQALDASGFLAAFAAGVGLRRAEIRVVNLQPADQFSDSNNRPPAEELVNPHIRHEPGETNPTSSAGLVVGDALSFGDTVERLFAAMIIIVLGITLAHHWAPMGLLMAALLFVVIRPLSVWIATAGMKAPVEQRLILGWLGIRGIGSINYIAFAFTHGLAGSEVTRMADMAFTLIVASVVVHGMSVTPLLSWRQAKKTARERDKP
ncbi:sodium/proton antiporter (CPA1 family) [Gibbsiella quercinecans]|uniref:Sodium:proton antiporter n=1 Tax=Gibbsiella quercinecans TaxID=929813 RepID=A0A250B610_9GAMM|nr:sodium:proton antiporter [Gibbsiella quercinecans]ATA21614.1 sodium:proton antiporter [Gibbsiella quercinecans]RLM06073.1 sodium:proton antiporter [Gibbsiella quercinecans]RLM06229.1 sodium:proton antiporter [Gibbsiella quercinecans]TCT88859.1 sodium/proton antiporter (CPA1 family) [Gibbsiella quercinecans]